MWSQRTKSYQGIESYWECTGMFWDRIDIIDTIVPKWGRLSSAFWQSKLGTPENDDEPMDFVKPLPVAFYAQIICKCRDMLSPGLSILQPLLKSAVWQSD